MLPEKILVLGVEILQLRLARLGNVGNIGAGDKEGVGDALLVARAEERIDQGGRGDGATGNRARQVAAGDVAAEQSDITILGELVGGEDVGEEVAVEGAGAVVEGRVGDDRVAHHPVVDEKTQAALLEIQQIGGDDAIEYRVDEADLLGLLDGEIAAEHTVHAIDLAAYRGLQLVGLDLDVADAGDRRLGGAALTEDVADAPNAEADDQQGEEDLEDEGAGFRPDGLQHGTRPNLRQGGRKSRRIIGIRGARRNLQ